jgi:CRISPR-associated protein Csm1
MSIQIFVEGRITASPEFLRPHSGNGDAEALGRHLYLSLAGEVIPRALLDELGLSRMLLGSAGSGGFLMLLPKEFEQASSEFLSQTAAGLKSLTNGGIILDWAITENLGDWSVVRKRLFEEMQRHAGTKATAESFVPQLEAQGEQEPAYFVALAETAREATSVSVAAAQAARLSFGDGERTYPLGYSGDALPWTPHLDLSQFRRRRGAALAVAVDALEIRLRRAATVEEYLRLSHLYKNFFAGELQTLLLRLPDCTGKVAILDSSIEGFTIYGDVDALLKVGQEMHRLFHTMAEVNLNETAGPEGKTLSAALAPGEMASAVAEAATALRQAQASNRDALFLFGRVLEWKLLPDALEIRELCLRMIRNHGANAQFVADLSAFFRESSYQSLRRKTGRFERPWRLYRRMSMALDSESESKDFQRTRNRLLAEFIGKNAGQTRLRPAGRVGLELTRIAIQG